MKLHPYQQEVVDGIQSAFDEGSRHVLLRGSVGPGADSAAIAVAAGVEGRVLIVGNHVTHAQIREMAAEMAPDSPVGTLESDSRLIVTSYMKFAGKRNDVSLDDFDPIVLDEHHEVAHRGLKAVFGQYSGRTLEISKGPEGAASVFEPDAVVHEASPGAKPPTL